MPRPRTATDEPLRFELVSAQAVLTARSHNRFVLCPACHTDSPHYLFHRAGVRFVRCTACSAVYVNPARPATLVRIDPGLLGRNDPVVMRGWLGDRVGRREEEAPMFGMPTLVSAECSGRRSTADVWLGRVSARAARALVPIVASDESRLRSSPALGARARVGEG
jgi:cytochrome c peroxidase